MKALTMLVALAAMGGTGCVVVTDDDDVIVDDTLLDYEPCTFDSDCDSFRCESVTADWGDRITTDSICTRTCVDELDCDVTDSGLDGTCAAIGSGPFLCYESCDFDSDCAGGFRCGELDTTGFFVCLPY
jgi:hypothetical protein